MRVKIISWNVRGLNGSDKRDTVMKLIHQWEADIYVLVETKLEGSIDGLIPNIWENRWMGEVHKEAMGSSGGIAILWDKRVWKGELVEIGRQSLTGKFTGVSEDFSWHITAA